MKLSSITIQNFRCFGPDATVIQLDHFNAFIGDNGTGKTTVLMALSRMFGTQQTLREVRLDDFHLPQCATHEDADTKELYIEVRIDFPELGSDDQNQSAIPQTFSNMVINAPGNPPYCRIRLVASWVKTELEGGDIQTKLCWIRTSDANPQEEDMRLVSPLDRSRIQVFYVPGNRDASHQLANTSGTLLNQLLRAIKWDQQFKQDIKNNADEVKRRFAEVRAIDIINQNSVKYWSELYDNTVYNNPSLSFMDTDFEHILRKGKIVFNPTHGISDQTIDRLSDGQQSLFYFAFVNTLFSIRQQVLTEHYQSATMPGQENYTDETFKTSHICDHICFDTLQPAPLTVFAVEEPENHLAPHLLGKIITQLQQIALNDGAQVFVSSHSPAIVARVAPENIRYFRIQQNDHRCMVKYVILPEKDGYAYKYIKQAVRSYPELYFSRLIILVEGDSEEYLIKRLAFLSGNPLDLAHISVIPLGGRFVNHLWKLLRELEIPHLTLLDLDAERYSGGWHTIHYVVTELCQYLSEDEKAKLLAVMPGDSTDYSTEAELSKMATKEYNKELITPWINRLEDYRVYLSQPLDIDLTMLSRYPDRYQAVYEGHPNGLTSDGSDKRIRQAVGTVLGTGGGDGSTYSDEEKKLFPWYSYLFLGKGKPTTHALAWMNDESVDINNLPVPLNRLFNELCSIMQAVGVGR